MYLTVVSRNFHLSHCFPDRTRILCLLFEAHATESRLDTKHMIGCGMWMADCQATTSEQLSHPSCQIPAFPFCPSSVDRPKIPHHEPQASSIRRMALLDRDIKVDLPRRHLREHRTCHRSYSLCSVPRLATPEDHLGYRHRHVIDLLPTK